MRIVIVALHVYRPTDFAICDSNSDDLNVPSRGFISYTILVSKISNTPMYYASVAKLENSKWKYQVTERGTGWLRLPKQATGQI